MHSLAGTEKTTDAPHSPCWHVVVETYPVWSSRRGNESKTTFLAPRVLESSPSSGKSRTPTSECRSQYPHGGGWTGPAGRGLAHSGCTLTCTSSRPLDAMAWPTSPPALHTTPHTESLGPFLFQSRVGELPSSQNGTSGLQKHDSLPSSIAGRMSNRNLRGSRSDPSRLTSLTLPPT